MEPNDKPKLMDMLENLGNLESLEAFDTAGDFVMVFCRVSGATTWFEVRNRKFTNLGLLADHLLTLSDTWEYSIPARG